MEDCNISPQMRQKSILLQRFIKEQDHIAVQFMLKWDFSSRSLLQIQNDDGLLPLHQACLAGNVDLVRVLISAGASTEAMSSFGWTALHAATLSGSFELVKFLVEQCAAKVTVKDSIECFASDLTLNSQIRDYLKSKMNEKVLKDKLDVLMASWTAVTEISRRHSYGAPARLTERRRRKDRTLSFHDFCRSLSLVETTDSKSNLERFVEDDEVVAEITPNTSYKDDKRDSGVFCMEETEEDMLNVASFVPMHDTLNMESCHRPPAKAKYSHVDKLGRHISRPLHTQLRTINS